MLWSRVYKVYFWFKCYLFTYEYLHFRAVFAMPVSLWKSGLSVNNRGKCLMLHQVNFITSVGSIKFLIENKKLTCNFFFKNKSVYFISTFTGVLVFCVKIDVGVLHHHCMLRYIYFIKTSITLINKPTQKTAFSVDIISFIFINWPIQLGLWSFHKFFDTSLQPNSKPTPPISINFA